MKAPFEETAVGVVAACDATEGAKNDNRSSVVAGCGAGAGAGADWAGVGTASKKLKLVLSAGRAASVAALVCVVAGAGAADAHILDNGCVVASGLSLYHFLRSYLSLMYSRRCRQSQHPEHPLHGVGGGLAPAGSVASY